MADLSFANDAGIQDGTGDAFYPDFVHKYMSVVAVRISSLNFYLTDRRLTPKPNLGLRLPP